MPDEQETTIKHYTSAKEFELDQKRMSTQGWSVISTTNLQPRQGVGRIAILGLLGSFLFRPKQQLVITYSRLKSDAPPPEPTMPAGLSFGAQVQWQKDREAEKRGMPPGLSFKEQVEWHKINKK